MTQISIDYIITFPKRLNEMDRISTETGCFLNPRGTPRPPVHTSIRDRV